MLACLTMKPRITGATSTLPAPEFVVLCSKNQEWRAHAEIIAKRGRPMLVLGPCDADLKFVEQLAKEYGLSEHVDHEHQHYYFWRPGAPTKSD